jgi:uncharacterized protein YodC (DUF2158 family)
MIQFEKGDKVRYKLTGVEMTVDLVKTDAGTGKILYVECTWTSKKNKRNNTYRERFMPDELTRIA